MKQYETKIAYKILIYKQGGKAGRAIENWFM